LDRRTKIIAAAGVLLAGVLLAMLFRREAPRAEQLLPGGSEHLVLRRQAADATDAPSKQGPAAAAQKPIVLSPSAPNVPPDASARPAVRNVEQATSRWGASMGLMLPETGHGAPRIRTHKVVDGDSLQGLAERYLGSARRAMELFAANRDVLTNPDVLPIDVELKIPAPDAPPPSMRLPERPLVPVPPPSASGSASASAR
jgi:nucleoid-associated protein YgaU